MTGYDNQTGIRGSCAAANAPAARRWPEAIEVCHSPGPRRETPDPTPLGRGPIEPAAFHLTHSAFTLIELLVVITIVSLLATLSLAAFAHAKSQARSTECASQFRQFQIGYACYSADNNLRLPVNTAAPDQHGIWRSTREAWCGPSNATLPEDDLNLREGSLFPYVAALRIYHCPADSRRISGLGRNFTATLAPRSVSLNGSLNGRTNGLQRVIRLMTEASQPSQTFTFVDEAADSIDDGHFLVIQPPHTGTSSNEPATWHNGRTTLAFLDGHVALTALTGHPALIVTLAKP